MPLRPSNTRLGRREPDLEFIRATPAAIADLTATLDRRLATERRPEERMRMLRETTNQITRTANDAIQAYRRTKAAVVAELKMPNGDWAHAKRLDLQLASARLDVLAALEATSHRYGTDLTGAVATSEQVATSTPAKNR